MLTLFVFFVLVKVTPASEPFNLQPGFIPVAINRHGEVVVSDGKRIHLYEIKQGSYTLTGIRSLPGEDGFHYDIAVSDASIYIQDKYSQTHEAGMTHEVGKTHEFGMNDLRLRASWSYYGRLCGVLHPDGLVYQLVLMSERGYVVDVRERKKITMKRPQGHPVWMHALSVCKTAQHIIIMEGRKKRLDIFNPKGMLFGSQYLIFLKGLTILEVIILNKCS